MAKVNDPLAVPSIHRVFGDDKSADLLIALGLFGQIDAPAATQSIAQLALFAEDEQVRTIAIDALKGREPRDYAGLLVDMIQRRCPTKSSPFKESDREECLRWTRSDSISFEPTTLPCRLSSAPRSTAMSAAISMACRWSSPASTST